jgi:pimeloyl-ACP methyl ester carboxylesterase
LEYHTLNRPGCVINIWTTGPHERPVVVFTHGAWMDHRTWTHVLPVVEQRYRVVLWDVRAHGRSRPTAYPFTIRDAADDLVAVLDHLCISKAVLVGHSMGGNIGQEVVFYHPDRVSSLVALGCTCNTLPLSPSDALWLRLGIRLLPLYPRSSLIAQSARGSTIVPEVRAHLAAEFGRYSRQELIAILTATMRCLHPEADYRIEKPLLLAHGANDGTGNIRAVAPRWARRDPHCQYAVIPDAGHTAHLDNPAFFGRLLLDFLTTQER